MISSRPFVRETVASFRALAAFPSVGGTAPGFIPGIDWSDHWAFERVGIPALMITDTAPFRYPHYHSPADSPDKVGHRWRNHKRRQKPLVLRIMVEQGRTRILFLSELVSRCKQIFPHRCCFQPVRRFRQRCPIGFGQSLATCSKHSWTGF